MQRWFLHSNLLLILLGILTGCSNDQKQVEGGWIGLKGDVRSVEFMPDGKVFWNGVSPRDYSVSGDKLSIKWLGNEEVFDIKKQGDTLQLENLDKRYTFMPMKTYFEMGEEAFAAALKKAEKGIGSMYYPYGELQKFSLEELEERILYRPQKQKSFEPR